MSDCQRGGGLPRQRRGRTGSRCQAEVDLSEGGGEGGGMDVATEEGGQGKGDGVDGHGVEAA